MLPTPNIYIHLIITAPESQCFNSGNTSKNCKVQTLSEKENSGKAKVNRGGQNQGYLRNMKPLAPIVAENIFKSTVNSQINRNSHSKALCSSVSIIQVKLSTKKLQGVLKKTKAPQFEEKNRA